MCSIADGFNSSSSTVACIASATEAKKTRPSPFSRGNGTIFSSAEKIAASVPSLPQSMLFRFPGSRSQRASAGGNVRPKTETVRFEKRVQLIEHHAGAGADCARFEIQLGDLAVVAKELNNQSVADRAARQTGARAARSDG